MRSRMWTYCFDRATSDTSRGNMTTQPGNFNTGIGNNWDCSVPGSANAARPDLELPAAAKLVPNAAIATTAGVGEQGHWKTVEAVKWMAAFHPDGSYYVPAHLERAGPFNPVGNNGFNVEHLRNFNNAAPRVAFGFESQPGHGASDRRGEYNLRRNNFAPSGQPQNRLDSVGGTTYGGTGVYAAQVGGVWDALLGEGRNWWFFASSDWHSRGAFGSDDRRSDNDFWPGEYQRNYAMVRHGGRRRTPQAIVDGLRSGNNWVDSGQLIDRLAFVACIGNPSGRKDDDDRGRWRDDDHEGDDDGRHGRGASAVQALTMFAARLNTDIDLKGCATMGEKLIVPPGADMIVSIVVRDPAGKSYSPYSFLNPSLQQVGINQPLDKPVLDHVDVIRGIVTGYKTPGARGLRRCLAQRLGGHGQPAAAALARERAGGGQERKRRGHQDLQRQDLVQRTKRPSLQAHDLSPDGREEIAIPAPARHEPAAFGALRDRRLGQPAVGPVDQLGRDPVQEPKRHRVPDELDAAHPVPGGGRQRAG